MKRWTVVLVTAILILLSERKTSLSIINQTVGFAPVIVFWGR